MENRVLSDSEIQSLSERFVCVKVDPRDSFDAMEHKQSKYVPEIVFLDSGKNYIGKLENRSVQGMRKKMIKVLAAEARP